LFQYISSESPSGDVTPRTGHAGTRSRSSAHTAVIPLATAAALDSAVFSRVNATEAIPPTWDERARRAREYYLEEPLVKNCVNSWRSFAVGDEVKIACNGEDVNPTSAVVFVSG